MRTECQWHVAENQHDVLAIINERGAKLLLVGDGLSPAELHANARTMAAATQLPRALRGIQQLIEQTYAHDELGNRTDGESPLSGADVVDLLVELEPWVSEALAAAGSSAGT